MDTTTRINSPGVATLAMHAILEHATDHALPCWRIELLYPGDPHGIRVGVDRQHLDAWVASLDSTDTDPVVKSVPGCTLDLVQHTGRLSTAIGDITVTIASTRTASGLRAVPSGVAS